MIIKAIETLAQTLAEATPRDLGGGMEILLPDDMWRALERDMKTARHFAPVGDHPTPESEPVMVRLCTPGGEVLVKRKTP
jgi:hypothetical protein